MNTRVDDGSRCIEGGVDGFVSLGIGLAILELLDGFLVRDLMDSHSHQLPTKESVIWFFRLFGHYMTDSHLIRCRSNGSAKHLATYKKLQSDYDKDPIVSPQSLTECICVYICIKVYI